MVSQPFSIAMVKASASAATAPVAKIALAAAVPDALLAPDQRLGREREQRGHEQRQSRRTGNDRSNP